MPFTSRPRTHWLSANLTLAGSDSAKKNVVPTGAVTRAMCASALPTRQLRCDWAANAILGGAPLPGEGVGTGGSFVIGPSGPVGSGAMGGGAGARGAVGHGGRRAPDGGFVDRLWPASTCLLQ